MYGPESSDEMGDLWLQVLPRSPADAATLVKAFADRETRANVVAAELLGGPIPRQTPGNQLFLGGSYVDAGRAADAVPPLERALKSRSSIGEARTTIWAARSSCRAGRPTPFVTCARRPRSILVDERLPFNLGNALNVAGQPAEAARAFERALSINPDFRRGAR